MIFGRKAQDKENAQAIREIQTDLLRTFSTPHGRRAFEHLLVRWGFTGSGPGILDQFRPAFLDLLDQMGINHYDRRRDIADALLAIAPVVPVAPEQEREEAGDPRADLESLGDPVRTW